MVELLRIQHSFVIAHGCTRRRWERVLRRRIQYRAHSAVVVSRTYGHLQASQVVEDTGRKAAQDAPFCSSMVFDDTYVSTELFYDVWRATESFGN